MKILTIIGVLCVLSFLIVSVSGYCCIYEEDNLSVKEFKSKINNLALLNDIEKFNITKEGFTQKLKYFWRCD